METQIFNQCQFLQIKVDDLIINERYLSLINPLKARGGGGLNFCYAPPSPVELQYIFNAKYSRAVH